MIRLSIAIENARSIRPRVFLQPVGIWMVMAILAVLNGVFRESVIVPRIDEYAAHVLSTVVLIGAILTVAFLFFTNTSVRFTLGEVLPNSRIVRFGGQGHVAMTSAPERFVDEVLTVVRQPS